MLYLLIVLYYMPTCFTYYCIKRYCLMLGFTSSKSVSCLATEYNSYVSPRSSSSHIQSNPESLARPAWHHARTAHGNVGALIIRIGFLYRGPYGLL